MSKIPKFEMPQIPSLESFQQKMPSLESFQQQIPSLDSFQQKIPSLDSFKTKFYAKIAGKLGGIDIENLPEPPTTIEKMTELAGKMGIEVDSERITEAVSEIEKFKKAKQEQAVELVGNYMEKQGIKLPQVPSEDDIINLIAENNGDEIASIDSKLAGIEQYINSILNSK